MRDVRASLTEDVAFTYVYFRDMTTIIRTSCALALSGPYALRYGYDVLSEYA